MVWAFLTVKLIITSVCILAPVCSLQSTFYTVRQENRLIKHFLDIFFLILLEKKVICTPRMIMSKIPAPSYNLVDSESSEVNTQTAKNLMNINRSPNWSKLFFFSLNMRWVKTSGKLVQSAPISVLIQPARIDMLKIKKFPSEMSMQINNLPVTLRTVSTN